MFFIIAFTSLSGICEVIAADKKSVIELANLLEKNKISFTVNDKSGKLKQTNFNYDGFSYWM